MADITIVDATYLSALGRAAAFYESRSLDAIYIPNTTVVITSTVVGEATGDLTYPKDRAVKAWIDAGVASGKIIVEETPQYPVGVLNSGEFSMIDIASTKYAGQPVTFVSNDGFFNNFNAQNLQPNQRHYTGQQQLFEALLEGGMSTGEYFVTSNNFTVFSGEAAVFSPGMKVIGSNGLVVDASDPLAISVTASNGSSQVFDAFDRFETDHLGNVQKIGTYNPYTDTFTPIGETPTGEPPECFLAGTMIDMWDGSRMPIEGIRPDDRVASYDKTGKLVAGRVTEILRNTVRHVLDLHTLMVTPGHVTL